MILAFNRTILECKLIGIRIFYFFSLFPLIELYQNVNKTTQKGNSLYDWPFNRTILECKLILYIKLFVSGVTFNRTILECKSAYIRYYCYWSSFPLIELYQNVNVNVLNRSFFFIFTFNRTILECKWKSIPVR